MPADKVSALGKEVGHELRVRREKAGYNGLELANRLGWSPSKVSRAETGAVPLSPTDIMIYLSSCGIGRDEMNKLVDLAKEGDKGYRLKAHTDDVNDETKTLIFHERSALTIDTYDPIYIPTLLQVESYTRAQVIESGVTSTAILEHRMQCAADRQAVLRQSQPPQCTFFIHENALTTPVGDGLTMSEQLLHLLFLTSWRRCTIRIVPRAENGASRAKNSFERMTFSDQDPMVTIDIETHNLMLDHRSKTKRYSNVLSQLDRDALSEEQSRTIFAQLADSIRQISDRRSPSV